MIVRCPDCQAKYEIATSMVPETGIKVRCPKCKAVFPIDAKPTVHNHAAPAKTREAAPALTAVTTPHSGHNPAGSASAEANAPAQQNGPQVNRMTDTTPDTPQADDRPQRPPRIVTDPVVARRMARAVIHEVLLGRDDSEREQAVSTGTALSVFGGEIASAFDLYMQKISPDLGSAPAIFRDAVNDILGGGEPVL